MTIGRQNDKLVRLQRHCLRRCLPENVKVDRNEIYQTVAVDRLKDRADSHLLKLMYKRAQNVLSRDNTQGRTRLYDGLLLSSHFPTMKL